LQELGLAVVPGHNVDRLEGDTEPLLREIDAQLLRVRCADEIVDLHALVLPWFGRDGSSRWRIADRPPHASGGRPPAYDLPASAAPTSSAASPRPPAAPRSASRSRASR